MLFQRLGVPYGEGQIPLMVPVVLLLLAAGLRSGEFRIAPARLPALALIWGTAGVCTLVQLALGGAPSIFSLGLVVALYAMVAVTANLGPEAVDRVHRVYLRLMTVFAGVSVAQMVIQYLGVAYRDYLSLIVPDILLLDFYNTGDPIAYGDSLYRSNGVLFLEPSFLSMFLGLAVALALYRGSGWLQVSVLLVGMVPPLAGSGFVVLLPAVVALALTGYRRNLLTALPAGILAVLVATLTPLGERYLERSTEATNPETSSSFRLVQPYTALLPPSFDDEIPAAIGHGAGTADNYLISEGLGAITQPLMPKVLYEYGILGVLGILVVLLFLLLVGVRARPWTAGLLLLYVYVNASFLQHTQVFLTLFWILMLPPLRNRGPAEVSRGEPPAGQAAGASTAESLQRVKEPLPAVPPVPR
ncbi:hypothetical protein ABC795_01440 [Blastococcus sp. HT6-30]|uniref:hypothetical protein n=1 Tax=Blastococcus sp. HT6-30 TaxID=3144843 RepID=UPI00321B6AA9